MTDNLRPPYCCGKCPPIEGGGYDCTCLFVKECPKRKELGMWHNLYYRLSILWGDILAWDWKRKRRKRFERMTGQDD